ncbi:hypothetical protein BFN01_07180 [Microbacterium sp. AR7-10]|nr:hypothetical protein BFN01_07180 [Microbacterium sp. AR7-10]
MHSRPSSTSVSPMRSSSCFEVHPWEVRASTVPGVMIVLQVGSAPGVGVLTSTGAVVAAVVGSALVDGLEAGSYTHLTLPTNPRG